ncbi:MAG: hypothetical protein COB69_04970 [Phycisphaera sp.]|nr:MAG: hypothetical protein COB69_04970 [Phycisphaera sp.]
MQAKPVQIAVIVIGLLVGLVGIFLAVSGGSGPDLANKRIFIDVTTGDAYAVSTKGRSLILPYRHPETNEKTLFPARFDEESETWHLNARYMGALDRVGNISDKIDLESGKVDIPADTKPKVID